MSSEENLARSIFSPDPIPEPKKRRRTIPPKGTSLESLREQFKKKKAVPKKWAQSPHIIDFLAKILRSKKIKLTRGSVMEDHDGAVIGKVMAEEPFVIREGAEEILITGGIPDFTHYHIRKQVDKFFLMLTNKVNVERKLTYIFRGKLIDLPLTKYRLVLSISFNTDSRITNSRLAFTNSEEFVKKEGNRWVAISTVIPDMVISSENNPIVSGLLGVPNFPNNVDMRTLTIQPPYVFEGWIPPPPTN